ncbi:DUF1360 domain-containing protein [Streptomyces sp. NPDC001544]|uniref:DUF1360 domain-containing protein n=1 Tax=Streptomyces sp. NPDC001544 TaxID=3364584 RepID=UPI0036C228B2
MTTDTVRYEGEGEEPLGGYALLAGTFTAGVAVFAAVARRRGVRLPRTVPPWDVALMGAAAYKGSRLLTRDKVTGFVRAPFTRRESEDEASEVTDTPRGHGVRRAVGELVSCPFCTSAWLAGVLVCAYASAPRATRLVCGGLGALTVADWLQYAWTWTQQATEE